MYRWADVILGGLDNREARVAINRAAARAGKAWIDGAIEQLGGVARVFDPACGPCYECTMNDVDWKMLEARRSCASFPRDEMEHGKVPTTPTTASVIAGIQTQEAVKLLHGLDSLAGRGFAFDGMMHDSYAVAYTRKEDCPAHDPDVPVESLPWRTAETPIGDFLDRVRADLGDGAVIETSGDLLASLTCPACNREEEIYCSLGKVTERQGRCPQCGEHRVPKAFHTIHGGESFLDRTLAEIGVPAWDVLGGVETGWNSDFTNSPATVTKYSGRWPLRVAPAPRTSREKEPLANRKTEGSHANSGCRCWLVQQCGLQQS